MALEEGSTTLPPTLTPARPLTPTQALLWLLENAPGLPSGTPLVIADLGAGSCAACLGARYALRDYGGDDQPFQVFPIDVESSSARFREAFEAMTKGTGYGTSGRGALLPEQRPSQYLSEAEPGVDQLVAALLAQLAKPIPTLNLTLPLAPSRWPRCWPSSRSAASGSRT